MTLRILTDVIDGDPRIKQVLVGQAETALYHDGLVKKQGGEGWVQEKRRECQFRVALWSSSGKMIDETKPTIHEAVHAAYEGMGLTPPDAVTAAFPRPPTLDEKQHDPSLVKPNWRAIEAATPKETPKPTRKR